MPELKVQICRSCDAYRKFRPGEKCCVLGYEQINGNPQELCPCPTGIMKSKLEKREDDDTDTYGD